MGHPHAQQTCVFGLGWGDEGKGKVADLLAPSFDLVVRFNGGANAGHTVRVGNETFALHLLPTGVLHENVTCVIGPGVVVDPIKLLSELDALAARGIDVAPRLRISERAHLVLAYHRLEDQLSEQAAGERGKIGTTARGIGPCYADKMRRSSAVRFTDLLHDDRLTERVRATVEDRKAGFLRRYGQDGGLSADAVLADLALAKARLSANVSDTTALLNDALDVDKKLLFEGANGVLLDIDHGTYPYVTSSSTGPHGIGPGAGVPPFCVTCLIGTLKAYATRVRSGPFVTELDDEVGERIRQQGHEFGTTTGRPRRCGWFDAVAARYTARLTGVTDLALMHLDTLRGIEEIGVAIAYRINRTNRGDFPANAGDLELAQPILELMPGWNEELRGVRRFEDLPRNARTYVERIEALVGVRVSIIGVGPDRSQVLVRNGLENVLKAPERVAS
jgi:adenylosuccinate synthase